MANLRIFYGRILDRLLVLLLLCGNLTALHGCRESPEEAAPEERYDVRGRYVGSQFDGLVAVVHHEEIPGLMGAMQMAFRLQSPREIEGLTGGEIISFVLVTRGEEWEIEQIHVLPDTTHLNLPEAVPNEPGQE